MKKFFYRILRMLGLRKDKPSHSPGINLSRSYGNANAAIARIRNSTHPNYKDKEERSYKLKRGERKIGRDWAMRSPFPEHNGAWICGWYEIQGRECWVVCNPNNPNDYNDDVQQHEVAHDIEYKLGLTPPWHYAPWKRLFSNWYNSPSTSATSKDREVIFDFIIIKD